MTQQNALDLIVKNHPQFEKVYDAYQDIFNALKGKNRERLIDVLENYRRSGQNMDTAISTFKKNMIAVLNSVEYDFSNGPVEGMNRRIKSLKRSCFGFRNLDNFRKRIALIRNRRKKIHSISEVKFSRSSTPFDKDPKKRPASINAERLF